MATLVYIESNIADENSNKNYLTTSSLARSRSCSPALATIVASYNVDASEKNITSKKNLDHKKSNRMCFSLQLTVKHSGTNQNSAPVGLLWYININKRKTSKN